MSQDGPRGIHKTLSGIDDGLNQLLAGFGALDDAGGAVGEGPVNLRGFTPLVGLTALGSDPLGLPAPAGPRSGAGTGIPTYPPLFPTAGSHAVLKSSGAAATPMIIPVTYIPVPLSSKPPSAGGVSGGLVSGAKLHPCTCGVSLLSSPTGLQHSGGSFSIPAYCRPLTQLDFISTDDLDDSTPGDGLSSANALGAAAPTAAAGSGSSGRLRFSDFGDLADETRLGDLPTDDDLKLMFSDSMGQDSHLSSCHLLPPPTGGSAGTAGSGTRQWVPSAYPGQQHAAPAATMQSSGSGSGSLSVQDVSRPAGPHPTLRIKVEPRAVPAGADSSLWERQSSPVGSLKRRVDRLGLDSPPDSPRHTKRHSSGGATGSATWSDGGSEDGGDSPRSATPRFSGATAHMALAGSGPSIAAPSRFGKEHSRRQPLAGKGGGGGSSSTEADDPSYSPAREQQQRLRQAAASRQQQPNCFFDPQALPAAVEEAPVQQYRGVSRHRLTQRWEASLWLNGRQLYLGGFNSQEDAAHAYDLAALACKGPDAQINFPASDYAEQLRGIQGYSRDEVVAYVRRRSSAFSRGKSRYRGVSGHNGRWEARIGSFAGRKNVSFGVFESEEEAARQYDRALILEKGRSAKTNFPTRDYEREVAEYEAHLLATFGATQGPAMQAVASTFTLPRNQEATADEKKRHVVIYGEALRRALQR